MITDIHPSKNEDTYIGAGFVATILTLVCVMFYFVATSQPSEEDVQAAMKRYGCVKTNEFVGKAAQRLYMCADGWKYTEEGIRQAAYRDKL